MKQVLEREDLIYPIPLRPNTLPAAVKLKAFLAASHCRKLVSLAKKKGMNCAVKDRVGHASTTMTCRLMPEDDALVYKKFVETAVELNSKLWNLSLTGIYEPVSVLRYRTGSWIRPHADADYMHPDPSKLSCTIQLVPAEDFTGGVLTIAESEVFQLDVGDAVIFPSHMIHTVSPIESGERFVLAAWIHGPVFR